MPSPTDGPLIEEVAPTRRFPPAVCGPGTVAADRLSLAKGRILLACVSVLLACAAIRVAWRLSEVPAHPGLMSAASLRLLLIGLSVRLIAWQNRAAVGGHDAKGRRPADRAHVIRPRRTRESRLGAAPPGHLDGGRRIRYDTGRPPERTSTPFTPARLVPVQTSAVAASLIGLLRRSRVEPADAALLLNRGLSGEGRLLPGLPSHLSGVVGLAAACMIRQQMSS